MFSGLAIAQNWAMRLFVSFVMQGHFRGETVNISVYVTVLL